MSKETELIGTTWWVIKQDGAFLAETSSHRGAQGGFARVWSLAQSDAIHYMNRAEAEAVAAREFSSFELPLVRFEQVS